MSLLDSIYDLYVRFTPEYDNTGFFIQTNQTLLNHLIPILSTTFYVIVITFLPNFQKKHKIGLYEGEPVDGKRRFYLKPSVKILFCVWNLLLSTYSLITVLFFVVFTLRELTNNPESTSQISAFLCPLDQKYAKSPVSFWLYCFVISKFFELFDTVMLLIKNPWRKPLFLHRWHHVTVIFVAWYSFYYDASVLFVGCLMNTFVHFLMYLYYAAALYFPPPLAIVLTVTQMLQMVVGSASSVVLFFIQEKRTVCAQNRSIFLFVGFIYLSYLVLFAQFFYYRYISPPKRQMKSQGPSENSNDGDPTKTPKKMN